MEPSAGLPRLESMVAVAWEGVTVSSAPRPRDPESVPVYTQAGGVDEEFAAFMREHQAALGRAALLLCGNASTAEDMTQTALMRTYMAWSRVRNGNPYAYTRRTLVNLRTDTWRRLRREVLTENSLLLEAGAPDFANDVELRMDIVNAFRRLRGTKRRVLVLRIVFDLSEQDVADELGIPIGTVKSASARGLAQLRQMLGPRLTECLHEREE